MIISEEFLSIQGEGQLVGMPSYFIRATGCPLRCAWCDEPESSWRPRGERRDIAGIVARAEASGAKHIVLTGGEPLAQPESVALCEAMQNAGLHVTIETSGAVYLVGISCVCNLMSISPKLSHSTPHGAHRSLIDRHDRLRGCINSARMLVYQSASDFQIKFVVRADCIAQDIFEAEQVMLALGLDRQHSKAHLIAEGTDPSACEANMRALAPYCIARGFRLGQRLHLSLYGNTPGT